MSFYADHVAWQQRVAQEYRSQFATKAAKDLYIRDGPWFDYPELVDQ
jgi:hypothetical protein